MNNEFIEDMQHFPDSIDTNSSFWYISPMSSHWKESVDTNSEPSFMLMMYMSELKCEQLELIKVEQQMHSLILKCQTIRQNMSSKTYAINLLINEILSNEKQKAQKHTQTDIDEIQQISDSCDTFDCIDLKNGLKPNEPKFMAKTDCSNNEMPENLKKRFHRLPAMVKGYLTRRLMQTQRVLDQIQAIKDTTHLLLSSSSTEDIDLNNIFIKQLEKSRHKFYDIFFNYPKSTQMALIRGSRQHIMDKIYKNASLIPIMNVSFRDQSYPLINLWSASKKEIDRNGQKRSKCFTPKVQNKRAKNIKE